MEYFEFDNKVKIPMLGLGTFPLTGDVLETTIKNAVGLGYELIDTAVGYKNEENIGTMVRAGSINPDKVFITSKINQSTLTGRRRYLYINRKTIKRAYKDSCKNLNIKKLNAYLIHMPFNGCSKHYIDMMRLFDEGMVDVIGVSNFDIRELKELHKKCGRWPMMNQTEISPFNTQTDLIQFCQENGILVQSYSPFGRGNLVQEILSNPTLISVADNHNKTVGQVVLRFIVQQGVAVVARSTNNDRLKSNIDIFDFTLSENEMALISQLNRNVVFGANQVHKYDKDPIVI